MGSFYQIVFRFRSGTRKMLQHRLLYILTMIISLRMSKFQMCINDDSQQNKRNLCFGFSGDALDLRVVGGANTNSLSAPWHSVITSGKNEGTLVIENMLGGGNLITTRIVLTAAHIFWGNSRNGHVCPKEVRELQSADECHALKNGCPKGCYRITESTVELFFGVTDIVNDKPKAFTISKLQFHSGFNRKSISNDIGAGHDLAVLRTSLTIELSPTIQPICLPHHTMVHDIGLPEQDATITGFGRDGRGRVAVVNRLQHGCLHIVDRDKCKHIFLPIAKNSTYIFKDGEWTGDQICAQGEGVDSCQGDSGGGLIVNVNNTNIIIGVTSFGSIRCRSNIPGMYTNIFTHLDWIQSYLKEKVEEKAQELWPNKAADGEDNTAEVSTNVAKEKTVGIFTKVAEDTTSKVSTNERFNKTQYDYEIDLTERLVVLGGWVGNESQSDTVFMEACPVLGSEIPDLPRNISHGVGTVIQSEDGLSTSIILCGGMEANVGPTADCFEYDLSKSPLDVRQAAFAEAGQWSRIPSMNTKRSNTAVNFLSSSRSVWITGGRKESRLVLDTTELLTKQSNGEWKFEEGPKLSRPVAGHCSVTVSVKDSIFGNMEDTIIIIGGGTFNSEIRQFVMTDKVEGYVFEEENQKHLTYSPLKTSRSGHACSLTTDKSGAEMVLVAGGMRWSEGKELLDSVEFILLDQLFSAEKYEWKEHSRLPRALTGASMITKLGFPVLIGGAGFGRGKTKIDGWKLENIELSKEVLSYCHDDKTWKKTGEILETVAYHVSLALKNDICLEIQKEIIKEERKISQNWSPTSYFDSYILN